MSKPRSRIALFELRERYFKLCDWLRCLNKRERSFPLKPDTASAKSASEEVQSHWLERLKRQGPPSD